MLYYEEYMTCAVRYGTLRWGAARYGTVCTVCSDRTVCTMCVQHADYVMYSMYSVYSMYRLYGKYRSYGVYTMYNMYSVCRVYVCTYLLHCTKDTKYMSIFDKHFQLSTKIDTF